MLYILINNVVVVVFLILFVCSRLEEKLFKINMQPPAFRVGSEWVGRGRLGEKISAWQNKLVYLCVQASLHLCLSEK